MRNGVEVDGFTSPAAPAFFGVDIVQGGLLPAGTFDEDFVGFGAVEYSVALDTYVAGDQGGIAGVADGLDAFDFKLIHG